MERTGINLEFLYGILFYNFDLNYKNILYHYKRLNKNEKAFHKYWKQNEMILIVFQVGDLVT